MSYTQRSRGLRVQVRGDYPYARSLSLIFSLLDYMRKAEDPKCTVRERGSLTIRSSGLESPAPRATGKKPILQRDVYNRHAMRELKVWDGKTTQAIGWEWLANRILLERAYRVKSRGNASRMKPTRSHRLYHALLPIKVTGMCSKPAA
jgi:hypothetical protein